MTVQRLIDQSVPGVAAMIDDIAGRSEDAVGQPIVASLQTFTVGFSSRRLGRQRDLRRRPNAAREGACVTAPSSLAKRRARPIVAALIVCNLARTSGVSARWPCHSIAST